MNILALDASGPCVSVAVTADGVLRASLFLNGPLKHSQTLMPLVDEALHRSDLTVSNIGLIACVVGPGSFTGVRIGVSTARGLSYATGVPCVPVNALEALAHNVSFFNGVICPILDARRGHVYAAAFRGLNGCVCRIADDTAQPLDDFLAAMPQDQELLFLGDGISVYRQHIMEVCGNRALFAPAHLSQINAATAAHMASLSDVHTTPGRQLKPLYLRKAQAERALDDV